MTDGHMVYSSERAGVITLKILIQILILHILLSLKISQNLLEVFEKFTLKYLFLNTSK